MFPVDFEEYLWARGMRRMAESILSCFENAERFPLHEDALRLYDEYVLVGGMPEAVSSYVQSGDFSEVRDVHRSLSATYMADIARYIGDVNATRTLALWESIPYQLMRENKKFKFSDISKSARSNQYADSFEWLIAAGLIYRCAKTTDGQAPSS